MEEHKKTNLIPNSTQIPNEILDMVLPNIPEGEARCLLYICRRTFGFHKEEDNISFTQFIAGIRSRQGKQLDFGTGLSRPSVNISLKNLIASEAIFVQQNTKGNRYKLNVHMDVDKVVNLINQLRKLTKSSKEGLPKAVNLVNPQKIGNKEKQSLSTSVGPPVDNRPELLKLRAGLYGTFSARTKQIKS